MVYHNTSKNIGGVLFLTCPLIIQEFIKMEHNVANKQTLVSKINLSFFWKNGKQAMDDRALFGQFFKIENLNKITPQIIESVNKNFAEVVQKLKNETREEWSKINVNKLLRDTFSDMVESILFGEKTSLKGEEPLPDLIATYVNRSANSAFSFGNLLSFEMLQIFGLGSYCRETERIYTEIEERAWKIYEKRLKTGPKGSLNMLDLMIENSEQTGKPLTKYDITGYFILLQFAGADTSRTIS
jgi:cytochrome P450